MADNGVTCSMSRSGNVWDNAATQGLLMAFSELKSHLRKPPHRRVIETPMISHLPNLP